MRSLALVVALTGLLPTVAAGTTAERLSPAELATRSRAIVEGTVVSRQSQWAPDGKRIHTRVRIRVDAVWKGAPGEEVELVLPGGTVGELAQLVQGMPQFSEAERVLVFLEPTSAAAYRVVGLAQGKFRVVEVAGQEKLAVPDLQGLLLVDPESHAPVEPIFAGPLPLEKLRELVFAPESR